MSSHSALCVAETVVEYYLWLAGLGGTNPEELLALPWTPKQRRELLERFDDVNSVWALTAPLRNAAAPPTAAAHTRIA